VSQLLAWGMREGKEAYGLPDHGLLVDVGVLFDIRVVGELKGKGRG
jgi:hypothetical protein